MLVSDVKNFSSIAEAFPPDKLAQTMGLWYRECNAILPMRGATIDKFIGDAVLACWPDVDVASKAQALRAARDIVQVCESIQARHATVFAEHALSLGVGVAINQGVVAHGGMGAGAFTLLGEAVNATFRIEGLTRKLNGDVVVTEEFLRDWDEGRTFCVPAGTFEVKGHSNAVAVHIVQSFPDG